MNFRAGFLFLQKDAMGILTEIARSLWITSHEVFLFAYKDDFPFT